MPNQIRDIETTDEKSYPYIFRQNVSVPLTQGGPIRCNIYLPKTAGKYPVVMTYGPYGKDIPYERFVEFPYSLTARIEQNPAFIPRALLK